MNNNLAHKIVKMFPRKENRKWKFIAQKSWDAKYAKYMRKLCKLQTETDILSYKINSWLNVAIVASPDTLPPSNPPKP